MLQIKIFVLLIQDIVTHWTQSYVTIVLLVNPQNKRNILLLKTALWWWWKQTAHCIKREGCYVMLSALPGHGIVSNVGRYQKYGFSKKRSNDRNFTARRLPLATTFTGIDSPRPSLLRQRSSHHAQEPKVCITELNEKIDGAWLVWAKQTISYRLLQWMEVLKGHMEQVDNLQKARHGYEPAIIMLTIL
jgi:hypothetical protein